MLCVNDLLIVDKINVEPLMGLSVDIRYTVYECSKSNRTVFKQPKQRELKL